MRGHLLCVVMLVCAFAAFSGANGNCDGERHLIQHLLASLEPSAASVGIDISGIKHTRSRAEHVHAAELNLQSVLAPRGPEGQDDSPASRKSLHRGFLLGYHAAMETCSTTDAPNAAPSLAPSLAPTIAPTATPIEPAAVKMNPTLVAFICCSLGADHQVSPGNSKLWGSLSNQAMKDWWNENGCDQVYSEANRKSCPPTTVQATSAPSHAAESPSASAISKKSCKPECALECPAGSPRAGEATEEQRIDPGCTSKFPYFMKANGGKVCYTHQKYANGTDNPGCHSWCCRAGATCSCDGTSSSKPDTFKGNFCSPAQGSLPNPIHYQDTTLVPHPQTPTTYARYIPAKHHLLVRTGPTPT